METYRLGSIIREERERQGISQEELCCGICAVSTLSRIENGTQDPSLKAVKALLERLGRSTENLTIYADADEVRKHELEQQIHTKMMHWEQAGELLEEYRGLVTRRGTDSKLETQFILMAGALPAVIAEGADRTAVREKLEEALSCTMPQYREQNLSGFKLFTGAEILILNGIALSYAMEDRLADAIRIFDVLVKALEKREQNADAPGKYYPMLAHNLARTLDRMGRYQEAKENAEKGIRYCVRFSRMTCFPELLYYKGHACAKLCGPGEAEKYYRQAIAIFEAVGREKGAEFVRRRMTGQV